LPAAAFNHAAHVRLGYLCVRDQKFPAALLRVRALIKNYANSIGKGSLYDETIIVAFLRLIHEQMRSRGGVDGWDAFQVPCTPAAARFGITPATVDNVSPLAFSFGSGGELRRVLEQEDQFQLQAVASAKLVAADTLIEALGGGWDSSELK
jgi:hypothetical protein